MAHGQPGAVANAGASVFRAAGPGHIATEASTTRYPRSAFLERIEREGQVVGFEAAWPKADGGTLFIRENARAIRDQAGKTLYYEGTARILPSASPAETERERLLADLMHRGTR